ncbi:MAG: hypothetical protein ACPF9C_02585, partial [Flavobacteriaceae bacterium]
MNYSQTLTWLFERLPMYQRVGPPAMRLGLDQMNRLSAALGDPHRSTKCIHIACIIAQAMSYLVMEIKLSSIKTSL